MLGTKLPYVLTLRISSCNSRGIETIHTVGHITLTKRDNTKVQAEFQRYKRLAGYHQHCVNILNKSSADNIIQGTRNIYRAFSEVVDYSEPYKGLQRIVGQGHESAGRVVKKYSGKTWLDTYLSDCFSQVAGIFVNCMTDCGADDMFIATGFENWMRSPAVGVDYVRPETWDVSARHERLSDKAYLSDLFVFDASNRKLVEVILGIYYHKVSKKPMGKTLSRLTPSLSAPSKSISADIAKPETVNEKGQPDQPSLNTFTETQIPSSEKTKAGSTVDVNGIIISILADISGLESSEISLKTALADIGIDSLMGMELGRELEGAFKARLMSDELAPSLPSRSLWTTSVTPSACTCPTNHERGNPKHEVDEVMHAGDVQLAPDTIFAAFEENKRLTDDFITDNRCDGYIATVLPRQTELCIALVIEAFEKLGCNIRSAKSGDRLPRVALMPGHQRLSEWLYQLLEHEARLIDTTSGVIIRSMTAAPTKPSEDILQALLQDFPDHNWANQLTYYCGQQLADVLRGEQDGIKLIFGTDKGRELVTGLYGDSMLNKIANAQMRDVIERLVQKIPSWTGPLRILELGAGTGGTTRDMVNALAGLGVPIRYTFTDLLSSFVAIARKKYGKEYPFIRFLVHDIEKPPVEELLRSQHVVISSNAIHATHNLEISLANVRKLLRPDGFLMMLEITSPLHWVDMIFGLFEGWWLFEDGRRHAIAHQTRWKQALRARVIIAQGSVQGGFPLEPTPTGFEKRSHGARGVTDDEKLQMDDYVRKYTESFTAPPQGHPSRACPIQGICVAITGVTGSLGAHLAAHLALLPDVQAVFCLNRRSKTGASQEQQLDAFESRGITLTPDALSKLRVFVVDTAKPGLGLSTDEYSILTSNVTHLVHNSWPMTGNRPVSGMESQFKVMRNLIGLAHSIASSRSELKVTFQFVSSIAVMGRHSLQLGNGKVAPETRATADDILPSGYGQGKWICERMLDETLHQYPDAFRVASVRPGQIVGNSASRYWNELEHLPFLLKSSQTLKALPALKGEMCWTPVDKVAGVLADLLLLDDGTSTYATYHIDNPALQSWDHVLPLLAEELGVPQNGIIPFHDWVQRVRTSPATPDENPAIRRIDFLDDNFVRMSCGGLILDTKNACEHVHKAD
ncbi:hypothetical protein F5Y01DRAFT_320504 [Xylaria sp. FL0043]|nr:hypothetical protein F5Y01DRAFT_320504 [Xylaria sp. FL0043]